MVRPRGLEPPQDCSYQPLKLARLPFRHDRFLMSRYRLNKRLISFIKLFETPLVMEYISMSFIFFNKAHNLHTTRLPSNILS